MLGRRSRSEHRNDSLRNLIPVAALVAATLGVTAFGPSIAHGMRDRLRHSDNPPSSASAVDPNIAVSPSTTSPVLVSTSPSPGARSSSAASPTSTVGTVPISTVPASTGPASTIPAPVPLTSVTTPATSTSAALPEVQMIQIVPPTRDVIVRINGGDMASDALGRIALPADQRHGTIEVIGRNAEPIVQRVDFTAWVDGNTSTLRSLDDLSGPVAQIGFSIDSRVIVDTTPATPVGADVHVTFASAAATVDLPLGETNWLPTMQAMPTANGLVSRTFTYTAQTIDVDGVSSQLLPQQFTASPEALWTVTA
jgi:hypothetical protein